MYRDQISGNWHILKGTARQRWGEYTNRDLDFVTAGYEEAIAGKLQTSLGISKKAADLMIKNWYMTDHDPHYWSVGSSSGGAGGTMSMPSF